MQRRSKARAIECGIHKPAGPKRRSARERHSIRLATIGEIAAVLSHESRNLLGALKTSVQILRRNPHLTGDDQELLDIVESGSNRLGEVVTDFSTFRRAAPLRLADFNLHDLIEQTLASLQRDERLSSSIVIEKRFDPVIQHINGDHDQLRHALWHLSLNGAQAMTGVGTLTIETQSAPGEIIIRVRDTGPGIPARIRPRIFEPLFTTKTRGAGLGLTIVRQVIERHGGWVDVVSKDGSGTNVTIGLPFRSPSPTKSKRLRPQEGKSNHAG